MEPSVVLLPADVVIARLTAGGVPEPQAEWSETVSGALMDALHEQLYAKGVRFEDYGEDLHDQDMDMIRQINVLGDAIEHTQLSNSARGRNVTTSTQGDRDYRVGAAERERLQEFGTDYALIVALRANRATGGRVFTAALASLGGAYMETNSVQFRSLLIDLRDGHIKWANFDAQAMQEVGDPLKASEEKWSSAVEHLLSEFPL